MKSKENFYTILEYLNTPKDSKRRSDLKALLIQMGYELDEIEKLDEIYNKMDKIETPKPSERLTENFYEMLDSHIQRSEKKIVPIFQQIKKMFWPESQKIGIKIAYASILLLIGWLVGFWMTPDEGYKDQISQMSAEIREMKIMFSTTLLNQSSSIQKMKGIHIVSELDKVDEYIVDALLKTLNNDPNVNVRIMALQSLSKFTDNSMVREGLVKSISNQESSTVQLMLADIMIKLHEKRSVNQLKRLLEEKDMPETVRDKIEKSIIALI